jgi:hypothetical protein
MKKNMKYMKQLIVAVICCLLLNSKVDAQVHIDTARSELYQLNSVFDSSAYIGFDVRVVYTTDTVRGKFAYEEMNGNYIINNENMYYKMGSSEYIRNDSFAYHIHHDEKVMLMSNDPAVENSNLFPTREFVDSVLTWYDTAYVITIEDSAEVRTLKFVAKYDTLPYQLFAVYYLKESHLPLLFEMQFFNGADESDTVFLVHGSDVSSSLFNSKPVKRRVSMTFSNYTIPETSIFVDANYVYYNRQTGHYGPSEKYRGYRFLTQGVESDDPEIPAEMWPPPAEEEEPPF